MSVSIGTDMYTLSTLQPVAQSLEWETGEEGLSPRAIAFLEQCISHTDTQGLRNLSPETLVKLINDFWKWGETRTEKNRFSSKKMLRMQIRLANFHTRLKAKMFTMKSKWWSR